MGEHGGRTPAATKRTRAAAGAVLVAVIVLGALVATGPTSSDRRNGARHQGERPSSSAIRSKTHGTSGTRGVVTAPTSGPGMPTGTTGPAASPTSSTQVSGTVADDPEPDLRLVRTAIDPGSCRWNIDTLDLVATGRVRNDNPVDVVVEIDVSFRDAGGNELDVASDLAALEPGQELPWDVLGASVDPPAGALACSVSLI